MKRVVQAGVFKAECLRIMDEISTTKKPIIVTKHRVPIVKIVPIEEKRQPLFGSMKNTARILGDIIKSTEEVWGADS